MLMVNKHVGKIQVDDLDKMQYNAIPDGDLWRVGIVKELNDIESGVKVIPDFANEEIKSMSDYIYTSSPIYFIYFYYCIKP